VIRASMQAVETIGCRLRDALRAWCAIGVPIPALAWASGDVTASDLAMTGAVAPAFDVDRFVADLFRAEGGSLVRLARLFVDDRNAAEDLVQEAFIRLARSARRIEDPARAPAYLRSIVLNLARDHNRRGLVSLRHRSPITDQQAGVDEELAVRDDQRQVLDALRELPARQRACLVLRYYDELGIDDIAATLGVSRNSVKTHLRRGLDALETRLTADREVAV
jgi:RNA polymerase sigma-70 factor (sigma-E family)